MTQDIKDRIAKVYALVNQGGTEGERAAAKAALDRIIEKYNLDESILNELEYKIYWFKYSKMIELRLLEGIMNFMVPEVIHRSARGTRKVRAKLKYGEWVTIECSYEYFRRHMKEEWNRIVMPQLAKCRKGKTKTALRKELTILFIDQYLIRSKLVDPKNLISINTADMSMEEKRRRLSVDGIQGGEYNKQVVGGNLLNA